MALTFPTRANCPNHAAIPGQPARAKHCRCHQPIMFTADDTCVRCGHYPKQIIAATWQTRAQTIASRNALKAAA